MSTELTSKIISTSALQTEQLGEQLGRKLRGGEAIELVSDLGGGKTTFVRGLARGVGSKDKVSSPSFTLSNEYQANKLTLHHFDFYRLREPGILRNELAEILEDPQAVTVVEWANIVEDVLPADKLTVHIRATGEESREIELSYPENRKYLELEVKD
ncbi:MAG TPA: tRNA (adenosine(37)-N6)-threonylcarbamoyltransferase complex ATPase subunit type 1 TsaE [Candidatus Saccharimonadales bacterium]|nr:tRNA (adenosine(37)-N6)-threonylcarbamoyltransferase complex ATPase subunit type 1 TsaE [Candidatus Saccharimonadales bacterium]